MTNILISNFHLWVGCPLDLLHHVKVWYFGPFNRKLSVYSCDKASNTII